MSENPLYSEENISSSKINEDLSNYPLMTCVRPRRPKYSGSLLSPAMCETLLCGVMSSMPKPLQVQTTSSLSRGGPEWSTPRRFHCSLICKQMPDDVRKYLAFTFLLVSFLWNTPLISCLPSANCQYLFRLINHNNRKKDLCVHSSHCFGYSPKKKMFY
jgi:hypothetical protein